MPPRRLDFEFSANFLTIDEFDRLGPIERAMVEYSREERTFILAARRFQSAREALTIAMEREGEGDTVLVDFPYARLAAQVVNLADNVNYPVATGQQGPEVVE